MTNWKIFCSYFTENRCDYHVSVCTIINDPFLPGMMPCGNCYCPSATNRTDVVAGMYHAFVHIFTYYYPVLCQSSHLTCLGHFPRISWQKYLIQPLYPCLALAWSWGLWGRGRGTPSNGLCGEAPPRRGTNFRRQVYERVGTSLGTYKVYILGIYV